MIMREPIDPFASVGTSNVFFQIVFGRTAPNDIANYLGTKPPGVLEHLRKLQELGVLELGDKEGKYQNYRINWQGFVAEFFQHIYTPRLQEALISLEDSAAARDKLVAEQKSLRAVIAELKGSEAFRDLVRGYFEIMVMNMDRGLYPQRTVWGAIYCFEDALAELSEPLLKTRSPKMRKLLVLLEKWNACAQRFKQHGPARSLQGAVYELSQPKSE